MTSTWISCLKLPCITQKMTQIAKIVQVFLTYFIHNNTLKLALTTVVVVESESLSKLNSEELKGSIAFYDYMILRHKTVSSCIKK